MGEEEESGARNEQAWVKTAEQKNPSAVIATKLLSN